MNGLFTFKNTILGSVQKIQHMLIWWNVIFHGGASLFYLLLLATTYSNGGIVMFVERMVTTWYLIVHIVFIFIALGLDLIHLFMEKSSKIAQYFTAFNNMVFISVVYPFGLFVPLTYWCLFYYNSNLILPNIVEISVPNWVSTSSHSVISLVALLEVVTTKYTYKGNYISALTTMSAFSISYVMCLIQTYVQFGFWVYPVLHLIPDEELWMVFLALSTTLVALFFSGAGLSFLVHGDSNESRSIENSTSTSSTMKPAPEKIIDSFFDVEIAPLSISKSTSSLQKKIFQPQLRDFATINSNKIISSKDELEIWHDAVYCPAIASFVENSRRARKSKPVRRRIGIGQNEGVGKWHKIHNRVSKPSTRDNQPMVQASSASSPRPGSNPASQRTISLTDQTKNKLDEIFRSADQDIPMANFPPPVADDIAMDSLEILSNPSPPSTLLKSSIETPGLLECKRRLKKPFPIRKEKSKSITVLFNKNTSDESTSMTNISSIESAHQDFLKMRKEKEQVNHGIKSGTNVESGKTDKKKKKENKGIKQVSKDSSKKSSFTDTSSSDRWSYFQIASRRGIGKLDQECLDFETKSLPVDVDDRFSEKKRDYRRDVDDDGILLPLLGYVVTSKE